MAIQTVSREKKLQTIIESEKVLNEIQDIDILLERLLSEARSIVNADAGSIYIRKHNMLTIKYAQNDSLQRMLECGRKLPFSFFTFEINEKSISGYSVLTGTILNIADAYTLPDDKPYKFNKQPDSLTGYRTKAILTVPLITGNKETLGVLQIINPLDEKGQIVEFDKNDELYINHFASGAVQALERARLTRAMVLRMINMARLRDPKETGSHVQRVSSYAVEIYDRWAFKRGIDVSEQNKFRDMLKISAILHDVGKVGIPDAILKLPRAFTREEYDIIKTHTVIGALLFPSIESPLDAMARDVALHHHEHWDGSGYPGNVDMTQVTQENAVSMVNGTPLAGEDIPLAARIVALADVFDALSSKRVYKKAWSEEEVLAEIQAQSGKHFDPEIVQAFMEIQPIIRKIKEAWPESC